MKNIALIAALSVAALVPATQAQVLSDGFESGISNWQQTFPDCSGTGTGTQDSTAHSGSKSLKVAGGGGYCNHVFMLNTAIANARPTAWVRFWMRHTTAFPSLHTTFIAMTDANDGNKQLRLGAQNGNIAWNRESDDATCPSQSPVGISKSVTIPTNTWTCVELMIDTANGRLAGYVNDVEVAGLRVGDKVADIDQQWLSSKPSWKPNPSNFKLGWESYGSDADTIYYDDVVISTSKIGCSGTVTSPSPSPSPSPKTTTRTTTSPSPSPKTSPVSPSPSPSPAANCRPKLQQCGGQTYTGVTCCQAGSTCTYVSSWYSQCK